ncbi:YaaL family protein [Bacillus kwashiorkori]|uniref:YaaL family protein n=1 Tax=Bacillus kwashiorkori TaxID=1522318 RepID=UPI000784BEC8|nr:YaaL family protein [Bacillus kwashiorkori]
MFFRKRKSLKKEYDLKLLLQMEQFKKQWQNEQNITERSINVTEDLRQQLKMAEIKYFYLFKEAKTRKIKVKSLL